MNANSKPGLKHGCTAATPATSPVSSDPAVARDVIPRDEVIALLPRCHRLPCPRVGVKWVGYSTAYCDEHGSPYLLDTPWAEFARKEGI